MKFEYYKTSKNWWFTLNFQVLGTGWRRKCNLLCYICTGSSMIIGLYASMRRQFYLSKIQYSSILTGWYKPTQNSFLFDNCIHNKSSPDQTLTQLMGNHHLLFGNWCNQFLGKTYCHYNCKKITLTIHNPTNIVQCFYICVVTPKDEPYNQRSSVHHHSSHHRYREGGCGFIQGQVDTVDWGTVREGNKHTSGFLLSNRTRRKIM